jgi:hypothetical protein
VRELRTLKRTRAGSRVRSVQGRLSIELGDEDEVGGEPIKAEPTARSSGFRRPAKVSGTNPDKPPAGGRPSAPVFHPLAYRSVVADWPIAWREQWGQRANELEETGLSWRDAETQAFVELWHKLQREGQSAPASSVDTPSSTVDVTPSAVDASSVAAE